MFYWLDVVLVARDYWLQLYIFVALINLFSFPITSIREWPRLKGVLGSILSISLLMLSSTCDIRLISLVILGIGAVFSIISRSGIRSFSYSLRFLTCVSNVGRNLGFGRMLCLVNMCYDYWLFCLRLYGLCPFLGYCDTFFVLRNCYIYYQICQLYITV